MQVVVCVKQIPDPASPSTLDPATNRLVRPGRAGTGRHGPVRDRSGPPTR